MFEIVSALSHAASNTCERGTKIESNQRMMNNYVWIMLLIFFFMHPCSDDYAMCFNYKIVLHVKTKV